MEVSDYPTCERTYITLRIYPESLDPSDVTARLGIEPSSWQRRGESRQPGSLPAKLHGWFLSSQGVVESRDMRRHLDWLLSIVESRANAILDLQSKSCRMDISCFWVSSSAHGGPSVLPGQMRELARLNLALDFDIYFGSDQNAEKSCLPGRGSTAIRGVTDE
ncbi:DUF4279 domain-containing protein [Anatilimnocola sp. NA78]|uniref:DUF4279 domain-containing protein n=1 Tax=Anatilimnocola sp. NA78 TaxID=3415683 RepID=UPI003CE49081